MITKERRVARDVRHQRIRRYVRGSAARPRLAVFRSLTHIYAQLIDDDSGRTLVAASSVGTDVTGKKSERAKAVGTMLGERAKAKGIEAAIFDRGGYRYHGRVKALADGARGAG